MTTVEAFGELVALSKESVEVSALVSKFLDEGGVIGGQKVDDESTARRNTGERVMIDQPSDGLLRCLAAARAIHEVTSSLGGTKHNSLTVSL